VSRTIGLFGGTFDPPHDGHVAALRAVLDEHLCDEIVVTVANEPQGKHEPPEASAPLRLEMARAAFGDLADVTVSDLEVARGGPTYTFDTVSALLDEDPTRQVVLVLGADAAAGLSSWHRAEALAALVEVLVVPRPGFDGPLESATAGFTCRWLSVAPVDLSSTEVRRALREGADPAGVVPPGVVLLIAANRLYAR
jgi:nicotinate-nucleotide adenylyltransferase